VRENADAKGRRYLAEGRLIVDHISGGTVSASCRGDGEIHRCGHDDARQWWCTCPARSDHCAHLVALRLVTIRQVAS
jgi:uncharacterized Zn finger protein